MVFDNVTVSLLHNDTPPPTMSSKTGYAFTVKLAVLAPDPSAVVTATTPVEAPFGSVKVKDVLVLAVIVAAVPFTVTPVAFAKLAPVIVTEAPLSTQAAAGKKLVTTGGTATTWKLSI